MNRHSWPKGQERAYRGPVQESFGGRYGGGRELKDLSQKRNTVRSLRNRADFMPTATVGNALEWQRHSSLHIVDSFSAWESEAERAVSVGSAFTLAEELISVRDDFGNIAA